MTASTERLERWARERNERVFIFLTERADGPHWGRRSRASKWSEYRRMPETERRRAAEEALPDAGSQALGLLEAELRRAAQASPIVHDSPWLCICATTADRVTEIEGSAQGHGDEERRRRKRERAAAQRTKSLGSAFEHRAPTTATQRAGRASDS